jgi:molybdopterin molybdotransferase
MISITEAFERIKANLRPLENETVKLQDAPGRVLAEDVTADIDSPPHDKSMMDGFALRSEDVGSGMRRFEILETIAAGAWPKKTIAAGTASRIMTGAPIPPGADAVVMIEQTKSEQADGKSYVNIAVDQLSAGSYTMARANNFRAGQVLFRAGDTVAPTHVGLLAEAGAAQIVVTKQPTIAVLPTGDEIVDCSATPAQAQIRNSNGPLLVAMANRLGLAVTDLGIGRDNESELTSLVQHGLKADILVLTGGVSMGEFDLVPGILAKAGIKTVFHKVAVKPGRPIWFGVLDREDGSSTCVFGLPGNPVSSLVGFHIFVRTAIRTLTGERQVLPVHVMAVLNSSHDARGDRPTFWPSRWIADDDVQRKIEPLVWHGSSDLVALGEADALTYFPPGTRQHPAGELVQVYPLGN